MISQDDLEQYLSDFLRIPAISDYCPNGLQVEGQSHYKHLVTGVTASLAMIEAAVAAKADCLLVHHGLFWKGDDYPLVGYKAKRIRALMDAKLAVFAIHLPLDMHETVGNNVQLAQRLGISVDAGGDPLVPYGRLITPMDGDAFAKHMVKTLSKTPLHIAGNAKTIQRVAWCTGAGYKALQDLPSSIDAFITGEISESAVHVAREKGIHLFVGGHHATERYGIQALGEHLSKRFGVSHQFIDIDSPW